MQVPLRVESIPRDCAHHARWLAPRGWAFARYLQAAPDLSAADVPGVSSCGKACSCAAAVSPSSDDSSPAASDEPLSEGGACCAAAASRAPQSASLDAAAEPVSCCTGVTSGGTCSVTHGHLPPLLSTGGASLRLRSEFRITCTGGGPSVAPPHVRDTACSYRTAQRRAGWQADVHAQAQPQAVVWGTGRVQWTVRTRRQI